MPASGGTYTEGVLKSSTTLSDSVSSLTQIGLTRLGSDGSIQPSVAKSWTISPDGKIYTFTLKDDYSAEDIINYFRDQKGDWSNIQIAAPSKNTLQFTLKQSYGLFLASTLRAILPYGPYKISSQTASEITLIRNDNKPASSPYIDKIVFKIYQTNDDLSKAIKNGQIDATDENVSALPQDFQKYTASMPRYNVAFLNSERITDKNIRRQIIAGPAFAETKKLTLLRANTDSAAEFTADLIKKFAKNNIKITEKVVGTVDLLTTEAKTKNYDILVYGFNTGYYDDLYPYWHTSQVPPAGMNFSLFKNKASDRLIEEARLSLDEKVRQEKYAQAKSLIQEESVAIFQSNQAYTFYAAKNVKGINIKYLVLPANRFSFASEWYVKTKRVKN